MGRGSSSTITPAPTSDASRPAAPMAGIDFTSYSHVAAVIQYAQTAALPTSIWDVQHTLRPLRLLPSVYGGGEARPAAVMGAGIFWLHARPSRQYEVVGQVLARHRRSAHMEYLLDDGTGLVWARLAHTRVPRSRAPPAPPLGPDGVATTSAPPRAESSRTGHRGFLESRRTRPLSAKARGKLPMQAPAVPLPWDEDAADDLPDWTILRPQPSRGWQERFGFDLALPLRSGVVAEDPRVPEQYRPVSMSQLLRPRARATKLEEWEYVPAVAENAIEVGDLLWVRATVGRWKQQPFLQVDSPAELSVVDLARQDAHVEAYYTASLPGGAYHQPLTAGEVPLPQYRTRPWDGDAGAQELYDRMRLMLDPGSDADVDDPREKQRQEDEAKLRRLFEMARSPSPDPPSSPASPHRGRPQHAPIEPAASPSFAERKHAYLRSFFGLSKEPQDTVEVRISSSPTRPLTREQEAFKARFNLHDPIARPAENPARPRARVSGMTNYTATVLAQEEAHYDGDRTVDAQATPREIKRQRSVTPTPRTPRKKPRKHLLAPERLSQKHLTVHTIGLYMLEWLQMHCSGPGQPPGWTMRYLRRVGRLQTLVHRFITSQLEKRGRASAEGVQAKSKRLFAHVVRTLWKSGKVVPASQGVRAAAPFDGRSPRRRRVRPLSRTSSWGTTAEEWLSFGGEANAPPSSGAYAGMDVPSSMLGSGSEAEGEEEADISEPEGEQETYQLVTPALIVGALQPLLQREGCHRLKDPGKVLDLLQRADARWMHLSVEEVGRALSRAWGEE